MPLGFSKKDLTVHAKSSDSSPEAKSYKRTPFTKYPEFHGLVAPTSKLSSGYVSSNVINMNSILCDKGYPAGTIINLIGVPKSGKSTWAIQETMLAAAKGFDVLYIYNESPRDRFMHIVDSHVRELGLDSKKLTSVTFLDMHRVVLRAAAFDSIESFIDNLLMNKVKDWLTKVNKPAFIAIDSLSKFARTYPAQAFYFAQHFTGRMHEIMIELKKFPVILCINQKSGGRWERDDESVLGGYGIVHEMDGSIVFLRHYASTWDFKDFGLLPNSVLRSIKVESIRDMDVDEDEHVLSKIDGKLMISSKMSDMFAAKQKQRAMFGQQAQQGAQE